MCWWSISSSSYLGKRAGEEIFWAWVEYIILGLNAFPFRILKTMSSVFYILGCCREAHNHSDSWTIVNGLFFSPSEDCRIFSLSPLFWIFIKMCLMRVHFHSFLWILRVHTLWELLSFRMRSILALFFWDPLLFFFLKIPGSID